jgi:hypothetical protein
MLPGTKPQGRLQTSHSPIHANQGFFPLPIALRCAFITETKNFPKGRETRGIKKKVVSAPQVRLSEKPCPPFPETSHFSQDQGTQGIARRHTLSMPHK